MPRTSLRNRSGVFVSEIPFVARKKKVVTARVIGFTHGQYPFVPVHPKVKRIVRAELVQNPGMLFSEFSGPRINSKLEERAIVIESHKAESVLVGIILRSLPSGGVPFFVKQVGKSGISYFKSFFRRIERIEGSPGNILRDPKVRRELDGIYSHLSSTNKLSKSEFMSGVNLMVTGRSLLMASNVIRELESHPAENPSRVTILTGKGHVDGIEKFLRRPVLGYRYSRLVVQNLKKWVRKNPYSVVSARINEIIPEFEEAAKIFQRAC